MSNMQIQKMSAVKATTLNKTEKKAPVQKQAPDKFEKSEFNLSSAMTTLQNATVNGKNPKFKEKDLKNLKQILTDAPEKWSSIKTMAEKSYVPAKTITGLAAKKNDVLKAMVPFATEAVEGKNNTQKAKYKTDALMLLADNASAEQINNAKPLIKTSISGENIALMALTPSLDGKLDKAASKILDMEHAMSGKLKQIVFNGDAYDTKAFTIQAAGKDGQVNTELLDKDLNRRAIENMSLYQSGGTVYQIKKVHDVKNNTTSKVRLEVDDQGYPTVTHEVRVIKDKNGNVKRKEYTAPSEVNGIFDIVSVDAKGNKTQISEGHYDKKTGITTVKKNMESLDGTKTIYSYEDDPQGNRISEYKIVDKKGNVLLEKNSTFEVVDENHFISTRNDDKYDITVDDHNINVKDMNNPDRKAVISIDKSIKGNKQEIMKSLKAMPGEELFKVAESTRKLVGSKDVLESYYDPGDKSIHSGSNLFVILHELGHARDFRDVDGTNDETYVDTLDMSLSEDEEIQKVYDEERKAFNKAFPDTQRDHIDYFINKVTHYGGELGGLGETIAESNALLTTPKTHEVLGIRSQYLQQYFPRTIAILDQKLNETLS